MLEEYAITIGAAAKLMNIFLDESPTGLVTDVFLEEETETVLVRFQHERGEDIHFHIHPDVFAMANAGEFAHLFLTNAYGIGLEFDDTVN
jgi:extradiol dioxygenase family protein